MTLSVSEGTPSARPILGLAGVARKSEAVLLPIGALLAGFAAFSLFLLAQGKSPADFFALVYRAGFGTAFSWENTLSRAAPLLLAALCVALPARLGLVVIGGEGAIVLGGVGAGLGQGVVQHRGKGGGQGEGWIRAGRGRGGGQNDVAAKDSEGGVDDGVVQSVVAVR